MKNCQLNKYLYKERGEQGWHLLFQWKGCKGLKKQRSEQFPIEETKIGVISNEIIANNG